MSIGGSNPPWERAGMDLYGRHAGFSPASKGRRYYLSQNIGPVVPGSAGPGPPPLMLQLENPITMQCNASLVPRPLPNFLLFAVRLSVLQVTESWETALEPCLARC